MYVSGPNVLYAAPAILLMRLLGAVVSVLLRASRRSLKLDHHAGTRILFIVGLVRPFIEGIFALVAYIVIKSGLIPIAVLTEAEAATATFLTIAFLSGFGERLARTCWLPPGAV